MSTTKNETSFTISETGDITQEKFHGTFTTKVRLSHRDRLNQDRVRREMLGGGEAAPSPRAVNAAEIFSALAVRIIKAPNWWTGADNGLELEDDSIVAAVYTAAMGAEKEAIEALKKSAEEAKKELAKAE